MNVTNGKPLQPLHDGIVLLVGVKASNFDEEIRNHPRVVMWDSQQEHWLTKALPSNTRAVFVTRFLGHDAFTNILKQVRARGLTIFNPEGTGLINKQVRELLNITKPITETVVAELKVEQEIKVTKMKTKPNKLMPLLPFIVDWNKPYRENAHLLYVKAQELGIETTKKSLENFVYRHRPSDRYASKAESKEPKVKETKQSEDVSVQLLDTVINQLRDIRQYIVSTTNENTKLKARIANLKRTLGE